MERLTFDGNFCDIAECKSVRGGSFCEDGFCSQRRVWERLKAYEDTGLTPEAVEVLCEMNRRAKMSEMLRVEESFGCSIDRLRDLAEADKEGLVVVLPCKIDRPLYEIRDIYKGKKVIGQYVEALEIDHFTIGEAGFAVITACDSHNIWIDGIEPEDVGKSVFLTREEAEAALEREGEDGH